MLAGAMSMPWALPKSSGTPIVPEPSARTPPLLIVRVEPGAPPIAMALAFAVTSELIVADRDEVQRRRRTIWRHRNHRRAAAEGGITDRLAADTSRADAAEGQPTAVERDRRRIVEAIGKVGCRVVQRQRVAQRQPTGR